MKLLNPQMDRRALLKSSLLGGILASPLLAATVALALLGNAAICGIISGPHDRYGSRLVWIAVCTVLIARLKRRQKDPDPLRTA